MDILNFGKVFNHGDIEKKQEETDHDGNHDNPLMSWILQSVVSPLKGSSNGDVVESSSRQQMGGENSKSKPPPEQREAEDKHASSDGDINTFVAGFWDSLSSWPKASEEVDAAKAPGAEPGETCDSRSLVDKKAGGQDMDHGASTERSRRQDAHGSTRSPSTMDLQTPLHLNGKVSELVSRKDSPLKHLTTNPPLDLNKNMIVAGPPKQSQGHVNQSQAHPMQSHISNGQGHVNNGQLKHGSIDLAAVTRTNSSSSTFMSPKSKNIYVSDRPTVRVQDPHLQDINIYERTHMPNKGGSFPAPLLLTPPKSDKKMSSSPRSTPRVLQVKVLTPVGKDKGDLQKTV
mmetsp:Transcript_46814/g.146770  ORF Transcript_46814/g.146770 Transcript_46814/m.146770 type:complete len:344 (-) Transcript_46814:172-1203(-)